ELAAGMRKGQAANSEWWEAPGYSALQDGLPQDLVDDFRHLGADEDAA
ncbi:TraG/TraD family protein, partial [Pseudomonas aeruginosa]